MLNCQIDNLSFSLPGDWSEMTLSQYQAYLDSQTDAEALAALSGLSLDQLRQQTAPDLAAILSQLAYLDQVPDFKRLPIPTELTMDGKTVRPITNVGKQTTFGQRVDVDQVVKGMLQPTYIALSQTLLSVYLYPSVTGNTYQDLQQANTILPLIDALPVCEALPLAWFLFQGWKNPGPSGRLKVTVVKAPSASPKNAWQTAFHRFLNF